MLGNIGLRAGANFFPLNINFDESDVDYDLRYTPAEIQDDVEDIIVFPVLSLAISIGLTR